MELCGNAGNKMAVKGNAADAEGKRMEQMAWVECSSHGECWSEGRSACNSGHGHSIVSTNHILLPPRLEAS